MEKRIFLLAALVAVGILALAGVSLAATKTQNVVVSASVAGNCNITLDSNVTFATPYDPLDTVNDNDSGSGQVTLQCVKNTQYKKYIPAPWVMTSGGENLNFLLFDSAGRTVQWPQVAPGVWTNAPNKNPMIQTLAGRIPKNQDVAVGAYSVNVAFTVDIQ
jgi:spore coat protein U-like protein